MVKNSNGEEAAVGKNLETRKRGKGRIFGIITIVVIILAVIVLSIFLILNYQSGREKARMVLSSGEISSIMDETESRYDVQDRVYFLIGRKARPLNADVIIIEIEKFGESDYQRYKQISYEIDNDFQKLQAYIPGSYFRESGRYRIKAYLDSRVAVSQEILVGE